MSTENIEVPIIDGSVICIACYDDFKLPAIVSSYFTEKGQYVPFFLFPKVAAPHKEDSTSEDDDFVSHLIGNEAAILICNGIARLRGYGRIVFIGLDQNQLTYFHQIPEEKRICIQDENEIEDKLSFLGKKNREKLMCRPEQALEGLFLAKHTNRTLVFNKEAQNISDLPEGEGVVLVERVSTASSLVAINYAFTIRSSLRVVQALEEGEADSVLRFIQKYSQSGNHNQLQKVKNKAIQRIGDLVQKKFLTCFTEGLPYSLAFENSMPISHVHLSRRVDFFVYNNVLSEGMRRFNSSVIFSPRYFGADEETDNLVKLFQDLNFYTKPLLDNTATVNNLDFYASYLPYDVLHICSHGGETGGYAVTHEFRDRKGTRHVVEYDEVVGFSPAPEGKVEVVSKAIFRKFNGYKWMSNELRKQAYPQYVYEDMRKAMHTDAKSESGVKRIHKGELIPASCAIQCYDSIHQGNFRVLASQSHPLVFNNTCWSWDEIAKFFILGGGRAYVGTLWAIDNITAVTAANAFYKNIFNGTLLNAFFQMNKAIRGQSDENIYIFWGLHFSTLSPAEKSTESRMRVLREIMSSLALFLQKIHTTKVPEVKENSIEIARKLYSELKNFTKEERGQIIDEAVEKASKALKAFKQTRETTKRSSPLETVESIDLT